MNAEPTARVSPLDALLRRAGATMVTDHGATVAANFGSMGGEVALCMQAVGIADRSELVKLEVGGEPEPLARAYEEITGREPAEGAARLAGLAWWCYRSPQRLLSLSEPADGHAVTERLSELTGTSRGLSCADRSEELGALAVVGPHAEALLRAAGLELGREIPPAGAFRIVRVGGLPVLLLREAPTHFLALTPAPQSAHTWWALHDAGSELGVGLVGREALDHYEINERTLARRRTVYE